MEQKTQCKLKKKCFFQITDVLYTMSFRDMLGWDKSKKMLESRPEDALGLLVKLVKLRKSRNISHFYFVRYL